MTAGPYLSHPQAGDAVALFLGLYLGHVLGDFVFQPGRLVVAKRQYRRAVLLHSIIVTACTAIVLSSSLGRIWTAVLATGIAHVAVEELSIRARRNPGTSNLSVFLLDQGLHVVAMAMIAALARSAVVSPSIGPWAVSLHTLATACGVATVAFAGSIFVFELQIALEPRTEGPDPILPLDASRVYGIVERGGALLGALLLPSPALGGLFFVPRLLFMAVSPAARRRRNVIAAVAGLALCLVFWALVLASAPK